MAGGFYGTWLGGRIYWKSLSGADASMASASPSGTKRKAKGPTGPVFYIWRRVGGTLYRVSTRCSTERAALKELERFEKDPGAYVPGGESQANGDPRYLDGALVESYMTWCRDVKRNDPIWLGQKKMYLAWWMDQLEGVDLRKASLLGDIEPALGPEHEQVSTRAKRIAVLKALYSYMRTQKHARDAGLGIAVDEDPTFKALHVPQSDPEARTMKNKAVPKEQIQKALRQLKGHFKDALQVQMGTGWHVSEVIRFATAGDVEAYPKKGPDKTVAGVLVCPQVKGGGEARTAVSKAVLAAGEALRARGSLDRKKYEMAVVRACKAAKVPVFKPGRLRHSVATHAINAGADAAQVSTFLHHKSERTTMRFYATHAVPQRPPTML